MLRAAGSVVDSPVYASRGCCAGAEAGRGDAAAGGAAEERAEPAGLWAGVQLCHRPGGRSEGGRSMLLPCAALALSSSQYKAPSCWQPSGFCADLVYHIRMLLALQHAGLCCGTITKFPARQMDGQVVSQARLQTCNGCTLWCPVCISILRVSVMWHSGRVAVCIDRHMAGVCYAIIAAGLPSRALT